MNQLLHTVFLTYIFLFNQLCSHNCTTSRYSPCIQPEFEYLVTLLRISATNDFWYIKSDENCETKRWGFAVYTTTAEASLDTNTVSLNDLHRWRLKISSLYGFFNAGHSTALPFRVRLLPHRNVLSSFHHFSLPSTATVMCVGVLLCRTRADFLPLCWALFTFSAHFNAIRTETKNIFFGEMITKGEERWSEISSAKLK